MFFKVKTSDLQAFFGYKVSFWNLLYLITLDLNYELKLFLYQK